MYVWSLWALGMQSHAEDAFIRSPHDGVNTAWCDASDSGRVEKAPINMPTILLFIFLSRFSSPGSHFSRISPD